MFNSKGYIVFWNYVFTVFERKNKLEILVITCHIDKNLNIEQYYIPHLFEEDVLQHLHSMPETTDSIESYIHYVFILHILMVKFNLWIGTIRD